MAGRSPFEETSYPPLSIFRIHQRVETEWLLRCAGLPCAFHFDQLSAGYVIHVAIDGNRFRNKWVVTKAVHIVDYRLHRVGDSKPFDELSGTRSWTFTDIAETGRRQVGCFQAVIEQSANNLVGKELHTAIGVVDDEELTRAQQLVADNQ